MNTRARNAALLSSITLAGVLPLAGSDSLAGPDTSANTLAPNGGFLTTYYKLLPSPHRERSLLHVAPADHFEPFNTIAIETIDWHLHADIGRSRCNLERLDELAEELDEQIHNALTEAGYTIVEDARAHIRLRVALTNANSHTGVSMQIPLTYLDKFDRQSISIEAELIAPGGEQIMAAVTQQRKSIEQWSNFPLESEASEQIIEWTAKLVEAMDFANELATAPSEAE